MLKIFFIITLFITLISANNIEKMNNQSKNMDINIVGQKLYNNTCVSCHGEKGMIKPLSKKAVLNGKSKVELIKLIKKYRSGKLDRFGMGDIMQIQVIGLSDSDIKNLAEYISSFNKDNRDKK